MTDAAKVSTLNPDISKHILHTVLYTFPKVLTRRICLTIKSPEGSLSSLIFQSPALFFRVQFFFHKQVLFIFTIQFSLHSSFFQSPVLFFTIQFYFFTFQFFFTNKFCFFSQSSFFLHSSFVFQSPVLFYHNLVLSFHNPGFFFNHDPVLFFHNLVLFFHSPVLFFHAWSMYGNPDCKEFKLRYETQHYTHKLC